MEVNKECIADILLSAEGFLVEEDTIIDGNYYPCRPIYIEYLNLYPKLLTAISIEIGNLLYLENANLIFAMESAILPIASLISHRLQIPLVVVRKPNHSVHEDNEPKIFLPECLIGSINERSFFLDDAIWSGRSIMGFVDILKQKMINDNVIRKVKTIFLIDFMKFPGGDKIVRNEYREYIQERISLLTYSELVTFACNKGIISQNALQKSLELLKAN